jgi:hypothetical protein
MHPTARDYTWGAKPQARNPWNRSDPVTRELVHLLETS